MFKKLLKYASITIGILFLVLIISPIFLKGPLLRSVKKAIQQQVNANVNFDEDISIGLIRSFPNLSLGIQKLSIIGKDSFNGDTLAYLPELRITVDLMSAIGGKEIKVRKIFLKEPRLKLEVLASGYANWDIVKADTAAAKTDTAGATLSLSINDLTIEKGYINYLDRSLGFSTELISLNHQSSGDFSKDNFTLQTHTESPSLTLGYGGVNWLYHTNTNVDADLDMNMKDMRFGFKAVKARLNELELNSDGFVDLNDNDIDMDISFKALQNSFKHFLSIVPGMYTASFKDVKTDGTLALQGSLKGKITDTKMPATSVKLQIKDASFQYPGLAYAADHINIDLGYSNPDGEPDHSIVDLKRCDLRMAGEPLSTSLLLKTPVSDPYINVVAKGKLDLSKIAGLLPLEKGSKLSGLLTADLAAKGNYSQIHQATRLDAKGLLKLSKLYWQAAGETDALNIEAVELNFNPKQINMPLCKGMIGKNDFDVTGNMDNLLGYVFSEETLSGNFTIKSQYLNLNPFMSETATTAEPKATDTAQLSIVEIPANLDIKLNASIQKLLYDNLTLTHVKGGMHLQNSVLQLNGISADVLGGNILLNGKYDSKNVKNPFTELSTTAKGFSPATAVEYFPMMQKYVPIAKHMEGLFDLDIALSSFLDDQLQPNYNSMSVDGKITLNNAAINSSDFVKEMGKQLQVNWLQKLSLKPQQVSFRIRDGVLELLDSLNFNLSNGMVMKLSGQSKLNQSIQYGGWMKIPSTLLGTQNKVLAGWAKQASSKGLNLEQLNTIPVDIAIGGTITKPSVQLSLKGFTQSVVSNLKGQAVAKGKEEYEKRRQAALAEAKKKADMITKTAAEKAQQLRNEARIQGDKIVGEAKSVASQIRQEGDRAQERITKEANTQAAAIEAKATDPIQKTIAKKAAEKVRDEGRKKGEAAKGEFYLRARQTEDEGQKKSGQLQTQANKNADNIEQEAKEKADRLIKEAESGSSL